MSFREWKEKALGEYIIANYGKSLPKKKRIPGNFNVYGSGGITGTHNEALIDGPGIIIGRKGSVGSVYYEKNSYFPIDTTYFIKESEKYDLKFIYYKLQTLGIDQMNTHSAVPGLNRDNLYSIVTLFPEREEQKAIANILSTLDQKIEINNQINKTLENMAQTIFKQWFVDFEFPNEEGKPYKSSGGEMVESELGLIPKGWEVVRLEDIAEITMGQSPKGTSYNKIGDGTVFYQGRTDFTERFPIRRLFTNEPNKIAKSGNILMSVRAPVGDINIANEDCCIGRGLCALEAKNGMNSFLLYLMIELKAKFDIYNGEGTVFGSINQKDLKAIKIYKPNVTVLKSFEDIVSSIDKEYLIFNNQIRRLTEIRDTLLPKLMSGEIRVPLEDK